MAEPFGRYLAPPFFDIVNVFHRDLSAANDVCVRASGIPDAIAACRPDCRSAAPLARQRAFPMRRRVRLHSLARRGRQAGGVARRRRAAAGEDVRPPDGAAAHQPCARRPTGEA